MEVLVPINPDQLGGPFVTFTQDFEVAAQRDQFVLLRLLRQPEEVLWFFSYDLMYGQRQHNPEIVKIVRHATEEERVLFRVPSWIQSEESPECCGRPMFFVGQLDNDRICMECPPGAEFWWHDAASFYVFTCPQCLGCKAIGQQY